MSERSLEREMRYIDVAWLQNAADEPIRLVSELDKNAYEIRKIEFFRTGVVGFAGSGLTANGTRLGELPVPSLIEINKDVQFEAIEIEPEAFEKLWHLYVASQI